MNPAERLIRTYYEAFQKDDHEGMCALLADDVVHDVNQGARRHGVEAFRAFLAQMDTAYDEKIEDLVVMTEPSGCRVAAEFTVVGQYLVTDLGMPEARGQRYRLPAGAFFEIREGKITRVTTTYNLRDWIEQVSAA